MTLKQAAYIMLAVCVVLVLGQQAIIHKQNGKINTLTKDRDSALDFAKGETAKAMHYSNRYGNEVSKARNLELSLANAQKLRDTDRLNFVREFDGVRKDLKNLTNLVNANAELAFKKTLPNKDTLVIFNLDTLGAKTWHYRDKYNFFHGINLPDSTKVNGYAHVPIKLAIYWQKKNKFIFKNWRYGDKEYFNEAYTPNPLANLSVETITIQKKN